MANEITVPNLADAIRDRVRSSIVSVIPDEQIDGLVKKEFEGYFQKPQTDRWSQPKDSPFEDAVKSEIKKILDEKVRVAVNAELSKVITEGAWTETGKRVVGDLVQAYAPIFMQGIATAFTVQAVQNLQANLNNMQQGVYNRY